MVILPYSAGWHMAAFPRGIQAGQTRRRLDVSFDEKLRQKTEETAGSVRLLIESRITPAPVYTKKCESCSLVAECLPKTMGKRRSVKNYLAKALEKE